MATCQLLITSLTFWRYPNQLLKSQKESSVTFWRSTDDSGGNHRETKTEKTHGFQTRPLGKKRNPVDSFFFKEVLLFIMSNAEQVAGKLTKRGRNANGQLHAAQIRDAVLKMTCQCMHSDVETYKTRHISPLHTTQNRDVM